MLVILQLYVLCVIIIITTNPSPAVFSPFPLMISRLPLSSVFAVNVRAVTVTQSDMISVSDITAEADREPGVWMEGKGCAATSRSQGEKRLRSFPRDPLIAGQLINTLDCFFLFIQLVPLSKV